MSIKTSNWSAWVDTMPMNGASLQVGGNVAVANEGQHAILKAADPQGIVGSHLLLELQIIQQPGEWQKKENLSSHAHYFQSLADGINPYTAIDVTYKNESITTIDVFGHTQ